MKIRNFGSGLIFKEKLFFNKTNIRREVLALDPGMVLRAIMDLSGKVCPNQWRAF